MDKDCDAWGHPKPWETCPYWLAHDSSQLYLNHRSNRPVITADKLASNPLRYSPPPPPHQIWSQGVPMRYFLSSGGFLANFFSSPDWVQCHVERGGPGSLQLQAIEADEAPLLPSSPILPAGALKLFVHLATLLWIQKYIDFTKGPGSCPIFQAYFFGEIKKNSVIFSQKYRVPVWCSKPTSFCTYTMFSGYFSRR